MAFPIVNTPLKIVDDPTSPQIYIVAVTHVMREKTCITSFLIEIQYFTDVVLKGRELGAYVLLWRIGGALASPLGQHSQRVWTMFENFGKELLVDWSAARQKIKTQK